MGRTADRTAAHVPLGALTCPEVAAPAAGSILAVPLGSTEPGEAAPLADLVAAVDAWSR